MEYSEYSEYSPTCARSSIILTASPAGRPLAGGVSSVVGANGVGVVPARMGEPAGGIVAVGVLRVTLFDTAVLKAAAKPPVVLRARGSAGGDGGVVGATGVPGAGLT